LSLNNRGAVVACRLSQCSSRLQLTGKVGGTGSSIRMSGTTVRGSAKDLAFVLASVLVNLQSVSRLSASSFHKGLYRRSLHSPFHLHVFFVTSVIHSYYPFRRFCSSWRGKGRLNRQRFETYPPFDTHVRPMQESPIARIP
jgi:hypothetical protein